MRASGSSPLTRGKRFAPIALTEWTGLIPAHAGKTVRAYRPNRMDGAHPRSRGENIIEAADPISPLGSSPLTRGKPGPVAPDVRQSRAHPRSRGENGRGLLGSDELHGSSPLTRGKPSQKRICEMTNGLIPAHAGKTGRQATHHGYEPAHPRSRGENSVRTCPHSATSWLIPAHAGKT